MQPSNAPGWAPVSRCSRRGGNDSDSARRRVHLPRTRRAGAPTRNSKMF